MLPISEISVPEYNLLIPNGSNRADLFWHSYTNVNGDLPPGSMPTTFAQAIALGAIHVASVHKDARGRQIVIRVRKPV